MNTLEKLIEHHEATIANRLKTIVEQLKTAAACLENKKWWCVADQCLAMRKTLDSLLEHSNKQRALTVASSYAKADNKI